MKNFNISSKLTDFSKKILQNFSKKELFNKKVFQSESFTNLKIATAFTTSLSAGFMISRNLKTYKCETESPKNEDFSQFFKPCTANLNEHDSTEVLIEKLSQGNSVAKYTLIHAALYMKKVDCYSDFSLWAFDLDGLGIYGQFIYILYRDVCHQDLINFLAVLRARQIGIIKKEDLYFAMLNHGEGLDLEQLKTELKKQLPLFNRIID